MIYEITKEIATELTAKGVPYPVIYGPERALRVLTDPRFVIERDRAGNDELAAPVARNPNPRMIGVRWLACVCRIYARSTLAGAGTHDHEREADQMADRFTVALHKAVRVRRNQYRIRSAKLMSAAELELDGLEQWPGVVYRIEFDVDRAVNDTTWQGAAAATAVSGKPATSVSVSQAGSASLPSATTENPS